jgi:putative inorganic carbon (HCO3(-)) transporter
LACCPWIADPFFAPKLWLLGAADVLLAALYLLRRPVSTPDWVATAWVLAVSLSSLFASSTHLEALALALLPVPAYWVLRSGLPSGDSVAQAIRLGSVAESAVAVLQWCGADPFRWFGYRPEAFANPRMRVYGTLGNPDFVAAWCCATLPLVATMPSRRLRWAAIALQVAAILAAGSRIFLLFLPAYLAVLLFYRPRWWRLALLGLPVAAALVWLSPVRPIGNTIAGRVYLSRIPLAHWREIPLTGTGPGSLETRFAQWQQQWLRTRGNDPSVRRFAGPVDHVHNDYVEFFVEYGAVGLAVFLCLCGRITIQGFRLRSQPVPPYIISAAGGAAGLMLCAGVDFPFHRPAEWGLLWLLFGLLACTKKS